MNHVSDALNLLGQATKPAAAVRLETGEGPKLEVAWGSFHQGIFSSIAAVLTWTRVPKDFLDGSFFKECWVERRVPRRAIFAAALWHIVFIVMPSPHLPSAPTGFHEFDNTELTWSGPITDFPLVEMKAPKAKPTPRGEPEKSLPPEGADAFHPRQRIITDPVHPNHPRQTLINSAAPLEPPKILPNLPNVVQFQQMTAPARPRLQISQETLSKLRPRELRRVKLTAEPAPDLPTLDQKLAEIAPAMLPHASPARPKLELNAGAAPRVAPRAQTGEVEPAPEVGSAQSGIANGNAATFIALSASPAPPAPVVPPQGNLAARVSLSPEGKQPGVPGGSPNGTPGANGGAGGGPASSGGNGTGNGSAKNGIDVSISGGHPPTNGANSGLGGPTKISTAPPRALITKPDPHAKSDDAPERTGPPNFASLPAGAQPEQIFASKKIYKMLVNMPNLNSATGSWILNFSELRTGSEGPGPASSEVSAPGPLRKIDPKYPPTLINEHVEGEVVLYAVIRRDGSVDSIQLVRGIDDQLDANAMNALSQWKFRPATIQGVPIELEAIVHIPFRAPPDR
ncbi:MAG TPA: TonB family protein [Candidatus Polarisedimenticolia bacterium]|nr:TonB family protein [Candidatus Polarisedimenticolia bacterium]